MLLRTVFYLLHPLRAARLIVMLAVAALVLLFLTQPQSAQAAKVRFYYSHWLAGTPDMTPMDPNGKLADAPMEQPHYAALELIVWRHVGLSYTRTRISRDFTDDVGITPACATPPCEMHEEAQLSAWNVTLYPWPSRHYAFNAFVGAGVGSVDYRYSADRVWLESPELHWAMPMDRWFAGFEYTFDRIGYRVEYQHEAARKDYMGQSAEFSHDMKMFTVYIPFN